MRGTARQRYGRHVQVTLTNDDSGGARTLRLGDEITVILDENPTTGYRWHADIDTTRLQLTDDHYQGPEHPIGAGGTRQLTFAPVQPGRTRLHVVKRRPWEQAVVAEFDVALDVAE
jgi:inhibitor of cysteine peptidase